MKNYSRNYEFETDINLNLKHKIKQYLNTYNFKKAKDDKNNLVFIKKRALLNGWKFNPLTWEAEIDITFYKNNRVIINHIVKSNGLLTPLAFKDLFEGFLINLDQFINHNIDFKEKNSQQINLANAKVFKYHGILILGILLGSLSGIFLAKFSGIKILVTAGVIIGAITTAKILNLNLIKNNTQYIH